MGAMRFSIFFSQLCIVLALLMRCGVNPCAMNDCFSVLTMWSSLSPCADEISVITLPLWLCTTSHSTPHAAISEKLTIFSVLCVFLTPIPLLDHHSNSSFSMVVILNLFIISGHYPNILWLLW
jgi:hypothetical protein